MTEALTVCPPAHPHSRGENAQYLAFIGFPSGSSPLTRGKHAFAEQRPGGQGLIPTHAGKTPPHRLHRNAPRAHPHSRGENGQDGHDEGAPAGSSPLTRGKRAISRRQVAG